MVEKNCDRRCSGCAFKIGAKANEEIGNRTTAILSAFGGIPFFCHEKMGWTPDQETYPATQVRVMNALDNLMAAPKLIHNSPDLSDVLDDTTSTGVPASIFDEDRALIGDRPVCEGWKRAIGRLQQQRWFADRELRRTFRRMASESIRFIDQLKVETDPEKKKLVIDAIGAGIKFFAKVQREQYGQVVRLEDK